MMSSANIQTRTRILRSAWKLLEGDSGQGVRMADIAKDAGISRQAVYLHFPKRAELLIAVTRYIDEVLDVDARLAASRRAATGAARLEAFIEAWGNYIPEIHGIAKALLAMKDTDAAAAAAWADRMGAVRQGCEAAVQALNADGMLTPEFSPQQATDILWTQLSVRNWEQLTQECGWSQKRYIEAMQMMARRVLLTGALLP